MVFLGDYVDRRPASADVVDLVRGVLAQCTPVKLVILRTTTTDAWVKVIDGEWPDFVLPPLGVTSAPGPRILSSPSDVRGWAPVWRSPVRRLVVPLIVLIGLAVQLPAAHAIELRNEDTRAYTVRVSTGRSSRNLRMPAHSASIVVCVKTCRFRLRGGGHGGHVEASGDDVILIRDKKLVRRVVIKPESRATRAARGRSWASSSARLSMRREARRIPSGSRSWWPKP